MDIVIPIVFPDYKISVEAPATEVDLLPWVDWDNFRTPRIQNHYSNLGHAGVLFIKGATGLSKYYEYGRYDREGVGLVRRIPIPDALPVDEKTFYQSIKKPLKIISKVAGQFGKIMAVFIEVENGFGAMLNYAEQRKQKNGDSKRKPYDILSYSCIHFVKEVTARAGVRTPWMIDPRPNSYIGEFRDDFADLDYSPKDDSLVIEEIGKF